MTVAVAAGSNYWMYYSTGVLNTCGTGIDHAVFLVGAYQNTNGLNYWLIKNSWGPQWGENGYIRIDRAALNGNLCDICSYPTFANV